ncbi:tetratricopeptide repeat protein [Flavipsychrobacter stenotrophus]|nr:tetratricopeptide repeat protein [Flavipsychrobacter stenotrophus]
MSKQQQSKGKPQATQPANTKTEPLQATQTGPKAGLSHFTILSLVLAALSFALYFNSLHNGFVMDDVIMVKENTIVAKGFAGIMELLATPHMRGYLIIPNDTYRPLSLVMFAIEHEFFGLNPAPYHFFNIVVFAGCVVLFFSFLHRFFDGQKIIVAFIGAFLFAIHPTHTEVVANIKSRDELLCFFFAFMSLNIFMKYMKEGKIQHLLIGIFTLYLSFISKENVITFIGVVPVLFFLFKNDSKQRALFITLGTVLSTIAFIAIRAVILDKYAANETRQIEFIDNALTQAPDFMTRIATSIQISGKYLALLFIPYPLVCNYSYNAIPYASFANVGVIASMAAYGFMIWSAVTRFIKNNKDPLAFAILFYLATIALFNNMFILIGAEMGERFLFMASAGWCMAGAFAVDRWILKGETPDISALKSPKILAILVPLLLVFGGLTIARNADWKDSVSLYRTDLAKSPNDSRLNYYLGTALAESLYAEETDPVKKKEIDKEAKEHLRVALSIYPQFTEANAEMGRIFDRLQQYDSAEYYDKRTLQLNPNHPIATNNLGSVYMATGKYREAIATFKRALVVNPNFVLAYFNMGRTYNQLKEYDSAIYNYKKMLEFQPGYPEAIQETGVAYFSKGQYDSAEVYFKKALVINPNEANMINNLGAIYLNTKNYPQAIVMFSKSLSLNPNYINAYSNLGRAYFFNKQYDLCIQTISKQLSLDPKQVTNIPYIALSYQALGNLEQARKYEAVSKQYFSDFKLK